jgi:hypothetical protein
MDTRPIPGFRRYLITEDGLTVLNAATLKPLAVQHGKRGEPRVSLTKDDGKTTCVAVERLAALARGDAPSLPEDAVEVPGYGGYFVTPSGDVFSRFGSLGIVTKLIPQRNIHGYRIIQAYGRTAVAIHKLVLLAFVGPRPSTKHEARHLNGDKADNRRANLEWGTKKENAADKHAHGTTVRGTRFWSAVLDEEKVRAIRHAYDNCLSSIEVLAEKYGVYPSTIKKVCNRESWKHVI